MRVIYISAFLYTVVKAVLAFAIMAAIFGILIVVNLCRRHRGDISAQLREWKDNGKGNIENVLNPTMLSFSFGVWS